MPLGIGLAILIAAQPATDLQEPVFVSEIVIRTDKLSDREILVANRYASCMTLPYFAMPSNFDAKRMKCRKLRGLRKVGTHLEDMLAQIDSVVRGDPGSEASLSVSRKDPR
ncbi:hypothetical protein OKA06_04145 [Novosphingobium sp. MW5]|nr:hypothetical protein [Novosphingobium sp. MW5]